MIVESGSGGGSVSISDVIGGLTQGSVLFGGSGGILDQDNSHLFYDKANTQLSLTSGAVGNTPLKITATASQAAPLLSVVFSDATSVKLTQDGDFELRGGSRTCRYKFNSTVALSYNPLNGAAIVEKAAFIVSGANPFVSFFSDSDLGNRAQLYASAQKILDLNDGGGGGAAFRFIKMPTAPSAPAANSGVFFLQDNGAGKMQLCARFPTGAIQVIATEP